MKKKRLLVTASTFPRWAGDTEPRFILDLSKALKKYFDVTVLVPTAPGAKTKEVLEGVKVLRYHYFPIHQWETLCYPGAIVPRIKEKKIRIILVPFLLISLWWHLFRINKHYDFVHAHWLIPQGIIQGGFKKKYIVTGHGGDVTSLNQGIIRKLKIRCLQRAYKVTVVSEALKRTIDQLYKRNDIAIIPMGCDTCKFSPVNRVEDFFRQGDKKVVLFVGRLVEKKGVEYLIEAMKSIDALLFIVGEGPLKQDLLNKSHSISHKVFFWGAKTHDELPQIYASADIFVVPSVTAKNGDKEGLPTTIVEAMASGVPVIGTNHSGIPEIIKDNENGFLVEEKDVTTLTKRINTLLTSEEIRTKFILNGLKTAQKRDYANIAKEFASLLK